MASISWARVWTGLVFTHSLCTVFVGSRFFQLSQDSIGSQNPLTLFTSLSHSSVHWWQYSIAIFHRTNCSPYNVHICCLLLFLSAHISTDLFNLLSIKAKQKRNTHAHSYLYAHSVTVQFHQFYFLHRQVCGLFSAVTEPNFFLYSFQWDECCTKGWVWVSNTDIFIGKSGRNLVNLFW